MAEQQTLNVGSPPRRIAGMSTADMEPSTNTSGLTPANANDDNLNNEPEPWEVMSRKFFTVGHYAEGIDQLKAHRKPLDAPVQLMNDPLFHALEKLPNSIVEDAIENNLIYMRSSAPATIASLSTANSL